MSGLTIDRAACIGCGRCVRACAHGGIELVWDGPRKFTRATDACVLCASCVDACPVDAISIHKDAASDACDLSSFRDIWVVAQCGADGAALPVSFELVGRARELADTRGCRVVVVLGQRAGAAGSDNAERLIAAGADEVLRCRDERLNHLDAEVYARWICQLIDAARPEAVLFGATAFGRELAPAVAVRIQTGLTADCTVLGLDEKTGLLQQTRPAFGGNLMATIVCPGHRPQMASVRPGIFAAPEPDGTRQGAVRDVALDAAIAPRVRVLETKPLHSGLSLADADCLLVIGRGIGSKKHVPLMRKLAEHLGAELGCTRPLVEAGWLDYAHQVGQTGVSVAPRVLLSLGVSGAIQHLAGISGAQTVIAVNEDPDAPIFGVAHYRVVADCVEFASALLG